MRTSRAPAALAVAVTLWAAPVRAEPAPPAEPEVVGLLDLRGDGVSDVVLEKFGDAVEEGLGGADDFQPATRARMREMLSASSWSPSCTVGACLGEVRAQTGAHYVVDAGLTGSGESYRFTVTLIETVHGDVVRQMSESCPACTVEDLASAATLATIELINDVASARRDGPTPGDAEVVALRHRVGRHAATVRRVGVLLLGVGLLAAGTAAYFVHGDRTDVGYPLLGAGVGLAVSSAVVLGVSFRF